MQKSRDAHLEAKIRDLIGTDVIVEYDEEAITIRHSALDTCRLAVKIERALEWRRG